MAGEQIELTATDGIARITLNQPERRNALTREMLGTLGAIVADLGSDAGTRVLVIDGAGPVFSAGHDLAEMVGRDGAFYEELFGMCSEVMLGLQRIPQPVIAKVHGAATAAGCQLVAACDLAIASDDCRFATPGVQIGLFCSTPMVPISRAVGRKRALEMLLTGEWINAATAVEWGLINHAVPRSQLDEAVGDMARRIMEYSGEVIALGKAAFYEQLDRPEQKAYDAATSAMSANAAHGDAQEGMRAFLDKRKPEWPSRRR